MGQVKQAIPQLQAAIAAAEEEETLADDLDGGLQDDLQDIDGASRWIADAHQQMAQAQLTRSKSRLARARAIHHLERFLELAEGDNPGRDEAEQNLKRLRR